MGEMAVAELRRTVEGERPLQEAGLGGLEW